MSANTDEKKAKRGNGEGSLYFDESRNRYRGVVTVVKGVRKSVYGKTKKEVVQKMDDLKNGGYCSPANATVEEYLERFIDNEYRKNLVKETTYRRKKDILKKIQQHPLAHMRIQAVTPADIDDFLLSLTDYSNSLIRKEYALLKRCFDDNVPDVIKVSPMAKIKCPKSRKKDVKQRALTIAEQQKLLGVLNGNVKYREQMLIMLNTGMRMGEINALTPGDVNLQFKTVSVQRTITRGDKDAPVVGDDTKTKAGKRLLPLSRATERLFTEILKNYSPNDENLLFNYKGKPIATSYVNAEFQKICKENDIIDKSVAGKVSLHSLRHTYATRCIEAGMSAKVLQELLGHTDIKITMNTYCDAFEAFKTVDIGKAEAYLERLFS